MIKLILAEGCSAISGVEQLDYKEWNQDPRGEELEYSEHTWPALMWKEKFPQAKYYPTARNGSSNMSIRRRVIYYVRKFLEEGYKPHEILVCIQWSGVDRMEFSKSQSYNFSKSSEFGFENLNSVYMDNIGDNKSWLKIHNFDSIIKPLYKHHYLSDDMLYYTYSNIDAVNNFLKLKNITCYQSAGFSNLFEKPLKRNKFVDDLIEQNSKIHYELNPLDNQEKMGFFQYCSENLPKNYIGPRGHPLLNGHQFWYEKIKNWYNIR